MYPPQLSASIVGFSLVDERIAFILVIKGLVIRAHRSTMQPTQPSWRPWVGCVKVAFAVLLRPHNNSSDNITDPATMQGNILRSKAVSLGPVFLQLLSEGSHRWAQRSWISHQRFYNTVLLSWCTSNAKLLLNICYKCTHAYIHTHSIMESNEQFSLKHLT